MPLLITSAHDVSPATWDAYVEAHPDATGYHLAGWRLPTERALCHRWRPLVAEEEGRIRGVLPLVEVRRAVFRPQLITGPFGLYNGAIGDTPEIEGALYDRARQIARQLGATFLMVKTTRPHPALQTDQWIVESHFSHSWLDLPPTPEELWRSLRSEIRNRVRKAEKHGLEVHRGWEHVDGFYEVYNRRMHELGSPVQPRRFFEDVCGGLGENADIFAVRHRGEVVGGATYFSFRHTGYVPWIGCNSDYFGTGIYQLLYWKILEAVTGEIRTFDFGRSTLGPDSASSTQTAKQRWRAKTAPVYHYFHVLQSQHEKMPLPTDGWVATAFTETWKRLPSAVTGFLGPALYRYFVAR
jgi:FemAB-related protein (PEP-CTERM system-associated)